MPRVQVSLLVPRDAARVEHEMAQRPKSVESEEAEDVTDERHLFQRRDCWRCLSLPLGILDLVVGLQLRGAQRRKVGQQQPRVPAQPRALGAANRTAKLDLGRVQESRQPRKEVGLDEERERAEHRVGKDADVEHELVHAVEADRRREREDPQMTQEEHRHDAEVEEEAAPREEPREPPGLSHVGGQVPRVRSVRAEPDLERLRVEEPVLVHLGDGAVEVGHGEDELEEQKVPIRYGDVRGRVEQLPARAAPVPKDAQHVVYRGPTAPTCERGQRRHVADEDVMVVVIRLAQNKKVRKSRG
mmetsp:Transcript_22576/g.47513  ORF Transcript_22576/g.47513 Transcript_22576/m.47513 type:complete len:301 (-) Transcript_22576:480-1382(-)